MNLNPFKRSMIVLFISTCIPLLTQAKSNSENSIQEKLAALETASGGQLGVYATNTKNNAHIEYRADQRFPFASTFKVLVVSAVLKQSMKDKYLLQQKIFYKESELVEPSPITKKHVASGMTISELSAAAIMYGDNTAVNLLVKKLGGIETINTYVHSIDDNTFRLDGWEPMLNQNPAYIQDTSTPKAMGKDVEHLTLGKLLARAQQEQLISWMKGNTTGDHRIRAGVPKGWIVGDRTGGGNDYGVTNDIGIIYPPHCSPIVIAVYLVQKQKEGGRREDIVAAATRLVIDEYAKHDSCI